jgi:hypothetical protein
MTTSQPSQFGTVVRDGQEVTVPVAPIPQHNRPDGRWCRWSGCTTAEPHRWCPDRCQAPAERLPTLTEALAPYLPGRDPEQAHATDGDRGGPPPGPDGYAEWLAVNDLELRDGHLVRRTAEVERCSECGDPLALTEGDGYDGLCAPCADKAERAGRWS